MWSQKWLQWDQIKLVDSFLNSTRTHLMWWLESEALCRCYGRLILILQPQRFFARKFQHRIHYVNRNENERHSVKSNDGKCKQFVFCTFMLRYLLKMGNDSWFNNFTLWCNILSLFLGICGWLSVLISQCL